MDLKINEFFTHLGVLEGAYDGGTFSYPSSIHPYKDPSQWETSLSSLNCLWEPLACVKKTHMERPLCNKY